jgi:hypothetical protein
MTAVSAAAASRTKISTSLKWARKRSQAGLLFFSGSALGPKEAGARRPRRNAIPRRGFCSAPAPVQRSAGRLAACRVPEGRIMGMIILVKLNFPYKFRDSESLKSFLANEEYILYSEIKFDPGQFTPSQNLKFMIS